MMIFTVPFLGRLGQLYVMEEPTYGEVVALDAAKAVRHLDLDLAWNPNGLRDAPDRLQTPDQERRIVGRADASFDVKKMALWPSGTIGTLPEANLFLKHGIGAVKAGALSTTITNATSPSTTQFTLDDVTGLAVGDPVLVKSSGAGGNQVRWVTDIATDLVSVAPALAEAPSTDDVVKACVGYTPVTNPSKSLVLAHYLSQNAGSSPQALAREMRGCVVDKLAFTFDSNEEPMLEVSGPAQQQIRPGQSQPGAFTTVGTAIPSGIIGGLRVGAAAYAFQKAGVTLTNAMKVRNIDYGTRVGQSFYRAGKRAVELSIDAYVEDPAVIYAAAEAATRTPIVLQTGTTEGQIWAIYMPACEFDVPSTPDDDTELMWSFKGRALGTAGNDEIFVAVA